MLLILINMYKNFVKQFFINDKVPLQQTAQIILEGVHLLQPDTTNLGIMFVRVKRITGKFHGNTSGSNEETMNITTRQDKGPLC